MSRLFFLFVGVFLISSTLLFVESKSLVLTKGMNQNNISEFSDHVHEFRIIAKENPQYIPIETVERYYDLIGPKKMFDIVEEDPFCHEIGHNIGRVVFRKTDTIEEALRVCGNRCSYSCIHGTLMVAFSKSDPLKHTHEVNEPHSHVTEEEFRKSITTLCDTLLVDRQPRGDCLHSMGHLAMFQANYDIGKAIDYCLLFEDKIAAHNCATGAYMERMLVKGDTAQPGFFPCDKYKHFPAACYRYEFYGNKNVTQFDRHVGSKCRFLLDKWQRLGCFHGYGFAFHRLVLQDPSYLPTLCSFGGFDEKRMCIEGAAGKVNNYDRAIQLEACSYIEDEELRVVCENAENVGMNKDPEYYFYVHREQNLFSLFVSWLFGGV